MLIITYYWVPAGGSGVQRWLKFTKYLRDFGIEPVIFTVDNPKYPLLDESLSIDVPEGVEVIKNSILEPNTILSRFKNKKTSAGFLNPNPSFLGRIAQYIRANYFIPDARKFWIQPSVKKIKEYVKNNAIDVVITTGPPHSVHLIGLKLKKQLHLNWIADFRDPWTDIDYFHQLPLTNKSVAKHIQLEKEVLSSANAVIVVGNTMKANYSKLSKQVFVVTNGYDTSLNEKETVALDKNFSITHIGLMNADRNPTILWQVLSELNNEVVGFSDDLEVKLIGEIAEEVTRDIQRLDIKSVTKIKYVPHSEVKNYQRKSQVLLLAVNKVPSAKGIITGKIFEYLQAKRPILAIGPEDGDLAEILTKTKSGVIVNFDDAKKLKQEILALYKAFKKNKLLISSNNITEYHRRNLTEQMSIIIKKVVNS